MPFIRPIVVDLSGGEAAVLGGLLCSSNEADENAELIGDHGNDEAGDPTDKSKRAKVMMSWEALTTSMKH